MKALHLYLHRVWNWLNYGVIAGVFSGLLCLGIVSANNGEMASMMLALVGAVTLACLPPIFIEASTAAIQQEARQLILAVAAGILTGVVGWGAGLPYGALTLAAVAAALFAGYGTNYLENSGKSTHAKCQSQAPGKEPQ